MNKKVLDIVLARPQVCARRKEGGCEGRITIEHAFGRKYEEAWNCILLCWYHHLVNLNKELNRYYAYRQVADEELKKHKRYQEMKQEKEYLNNKFGA